MSFKADPSGLGNPSPDAAIPNAEAAASRLNDFR